MQCSTTIFLRTICRSRCERFLQFIPVSNVTGKKLVFTASLLDAQHLRDSVENKPASLLVVPLGKALSGIPPSWCGRQMDGNS